MKFLEILFRYLIFLGGVVLVILGTTRLPSTPSETMRILSDAGGLLKVFAGTLLIIASFEMRGRK